MLIAVADAEDPRVQVFRAVRDRDFASEGLFVGESPLVVEKMLAIAGVTESVLIAEKHSGWAAARVPDDVPAYVAPNSILEAIVGFRMHRGMLAIGRRAAVERSVAAVATLSAARALSEAMETDGQQHQRSPATMLCIEGVNNADNVGLLFRTAAAFGVDGVLLDEGTHDPLYRRSLRVSIGHVLRVPWAVSGDWPADLRRLRESFGFELIGATGAAGARPLDEVPIPDDSALIVGAEYAGLSAGTMSLCHTLVRIPMAPGVDSLNVAVAAGVCLHRLTQGKRR